jgi:hypothetical protein
VTSDKAAKRGAGSLEREVGGEEMGNADCRIKADSETSTHVAPRRTFL